MDRFIEDNLRLPITCLACEDRNVPRLEKSNLFSDRKRYSTPCYEDETHEWKENLMKFTFTDLKERRKKSPACRK